ncbi:MAG: hypothetical protein HFI34_04800 [Lachnospiraceae bacterium]|nr:hypothetical protein [Lachnospiraceae bacterium]
MLSGNDTNNRERLINRIMAGGGILIAGFTIFYAITFYGLFSGGKEANASETTEVMETQPETTTEDDTNYTLFESPYSDEQIPEAVKTLLNQAVLGESVVTGIMPVDNKISSVFRSTMGKNMTQYEKVRNAYDYMLYNFRLNDDSGSPDEEEINALCEGISFKSRFDMQTAYRTQRLLQNFSGPSGDYGAAFALLLRKMGLEAYYIDDVTEISDGSREHGYTAVLIDGEYYIFDVYAEKKQMENSTGGEKENPDYTYFCAGVRTLGNGYVLADVKAAVAKFESFATLPLMNFEAMISNKSHSVYGSVEHHSSSYSDGNSDMAEGELYVSSGDTVNLAGTVSSTGAENVWKLTAKIFDSNMNYLDEKEIYNQTTSSAYNEVSYTASEGRYVQLYYSVTDIYGRTCVITHIFKIWTADDYTTRPETEPATDEPATEPQTEPFSGDVTEPTVRPEPEQTTEPETEKQTTTKEPEPETSSSEEETTEEQTESITDETVDGEETETTSQDGSEPGEERSTESEE